MKTLTKPLRGVVPPSLTPLADRDSLDRDAHGRLLEHLIAGGSSAIFILGSTGESPGLSHALRRTVIDDAASVVNRRVPLLVGITDTSFVESLSLAEYAAKAGASAVVMSPPCYFNLSQAMFLGYLEKLAAEVPLPLFLYNIPPLTKIYIEPETMRAAAEFPNVYGVKDSSADLDYFRRVRSAVAAHPDFTLLAGIEEMMAGMVLDEGAHGGVCGGANLWPRLYVDLYEAAARSDRAKVAELQKTVVRITSTVYRVGEPQSSYMRGLKCAASLMGFGNGLMAEPYRALDGEQQSAIRQALVEIGLLADTAK
jgi:dihydrodipicolinate synthase/N-acetylneuraminate lyase